MYLVMKSRSILRIENGIIVEKPNSKKGNTHKIYKKFITHNEWQAAVERVSVNLRFIFADKIPENRHFTKRVRGMLMQSMC